MGLDVTKVNGQETKVHQPMDLEHGWVWMVMRVDQLYTPLDHPSEAQRQCWHIQGVATSKENAIRMCASPDYFIGPLPLDNMLPETTIEWAGAYFPLGLPIQEL